MFRFSCFHSPTHSQKPKKTVHMPTESMRKSLEDYNTSKPKKNPDWKSEGIKSMNDTDSENRHEIRVMRKSVSLGGDLTAYQNMTSGDKSASSHCNPRKARDSVSPQISSNLVHRASNLSPDCLQQSDKDVGNISETRFSDGYTDGSPHAIVKSSSSPYLNLVHQSRSYEDSEPLDSKRNEKSDADDDDDGDEDYAGSAKDWIVPVDDEQGKGKNVQEDYSVCRWEELPNEDFKLKRIEKWVMDLQNSSSLEETNMVTDLDHHGQNGNFTSLDPMTGSKNDDKSLLGMDAAKRYISSLSPAATSAQLANHGLVVIPFLSALTSLRALNLSGNSIVRITAGALPRGLHILNLSKNSISTIEGLRELTRLRVLDLSYNRILRIGHGLASCSSLKELYLAGNKISEIEGLHRVLKLNILDLRFNKLSTTKSLGQLTANHSSLQAISLEGNSVQKNIGDEQVKKFLVGVLPHLAYLNRQSIKSGVMKDSADRAARLGISAHHQIDRGIRSETKKSTRKSQGVGGRHVRLPPSGGVKVTGGDRQQFVDVSSKLVGFRPDLGMRRSHSEGLLRAV